MSVFPWTNDRGDNVDAIRWFRGDNGCCAHICLSQSYRGTRADQLSCAHDSFPTPALRRDSVFASARLEPWRLLALRLDLGRGQAGRLPERHAEEIGLRAAWF